MDSAALSKADEDWSSRGKVDILRHGLEISRHAARGLYVMSLRRHRKSETDQSEEVIGTRSHVYTEDDIVDEFETSGVSPITVISQGKRATFRPWNPYTCVVAAGLHNSLIHFPVRPKGRVFVLHNSLQTLSHIADVISPSGLVIAVLNTSQEMPSQEQRRRFLARYPTVKIIEDDASQPPTYERYERLLSLPYTSKIAFLMGLHERLGADSPIAMLKKAEEGTQKIIQNIFEFVTSTDLGKLLSLIVANPFTCTGLDEIRDVVLSHIDIFRQARLGVSAGEKDAPDSCGGEDREDREDRDDQDGEDQDQDGDAKDTGGEDPKVSTGGEDQEVERMGSHAAGNTKSRSAGGDLDVYWVMLELPTSAIEVNETPAESERHKTIVNAMKRSSTGARTGLVAKEQLLLAPYHPGRALLLLKYMSHRDARSRSRKDGLATSTTTTTTTVTAPTTVPTNGASIGTGTTTTTTPAPTDHPDTTSADATMDAPPGIGAPGLAGAERPPALSAMPTPFKSGSDFQGKAPPHNPPPSAPPPPPPSSITGEKKSKDKQQSSLVAKHGHPKSGGLGGGSAAAAVAVAAAAACGGPPGKAGPKTPQPSAMPVPAFGRGHEADMDSMPSGGAGGMGMNMQGRGMHGGGGGGGGNNSTALVLRNNQQGSQFGNKGSQQGRNNKSGGAGGGPCGGGNMMGAMRGPPGLTGSGGGSGLGSNQLWSPAELQAQLGNLHGGNAPGGLGQAPGLCGGMRPPAGMLPSQGFEDEFARRGLPGNWWGAQQHQLQQAQIQQQAAQLRNNFGKGGGGKGGMGNPMANRQQLLQAMAAQGLDTQMGAFPGAAGLTGAFQGDGGGMNIPTNVQDMDAVPYMAMSL